MKISEFAKRSNVGVETVRYYQRLGLISVPSQQGAYRRYTKQDLDDMRFVINAKGAGFSLDEIGYLKSLDSIADRPSILALSEKKSAQLQEKITQLKEAMLFLDSLVSECRASEKDECPILQNLKEETV